MLRSHHHHQKKKEPPAHPRRQLHQALQGVCCGVSEQRPRAASVSKRAVKAQVHPKGQEDVGVDRSDWPLPQVEAEWGRGVWAQLGRFRQGGQVSVNVFVCLFVFLFGCLSICLFVCLFVCLFLFFVSLFLCFFAPLPLCFLCFPPLSQTMRAHAHRDREPMEDPGWEFGTIKGAPGALAGDQAGVSWMKTHNKTKTNKTKLHTFFFFFLNIKLNLVLLIIILSTIWRARRRPSPGSWRRWLCPVWRRSRPTRRLTPRSRCLRALCSSSMNLSRPLNSPRYNYYLIFLFFSSLLLFFLILVPSQPQASKPGLCKSLVNEICTTMLSLT